MCRYEPYLPVLCQSFSEEEQRSANTDAPLAPGPFSFFRHRSARFLFSYNRQRILGICNRIPHCIPAPVHKAELKEGIHPLAGARVGKQDRK